MDFKKFLSNTQMGKLVANFMKKELSTDDQGKVVLSAEEEEQLTQRFGAKFVEKLKGKTFSSTDDNTTELFEAALDHARQEVETHFTARIEQLQNDLAMLAEAAETAPAIEQAANAAQRFVKNAGTFKANMALVHNQAAATFLQSGVMATTPTIEVDDVKAELGPYLSQGNNLDVLQELYQGFTTSKHLNWKRAVTEYKAVESEATDHVIQQFKKEWTPRGGANFIPLKIKNYRHKVDFAINPAEVGESWLFHLYDESLTPDQMPITRYIIDKVLLPKIGEDMEFITGKAKFVESSDKTEETMNGIETQLVEPRKPSTNTSTSSRPRRTCSKPPTPRFWPRSTTSWHPLPRSTSRSRCPYSCRPTCTSNTSGPTRRNGARNLEPRRSISARTALTSRTATSRHCLHGSPIVFSTPPQNFVGLRHKNPPQFITDIQKHDREVRIYIEFWYGVGFLLGEAVFAIVPDGYDPSTVLTSTREGTPGKWIVTEADKTDAAIANPETL
mgnify:CR=1 FL=1